ncbi:MAG: hypothetical protein WCK09_11760, partial [Bacteroidota bacterium]
ATQQGTVVSDATEASAGWYWQFNRKQGYQYTSLRTPATTWDATNDNLSATWEAAKDPCAIELGTGWRIPTNTEWTNVSGATGGNWTNWNGPFGSALKLHAAGYLNNSDGLLINRGLAGNYLSSTQYYSAAYVRNLYFNSGYSGMGIYDKSSGYSVRCVRETCTTAPNLPTSGTHVPTATQIIWNWNIVADAIGYKWNTTNNYPNATDMGTGITKTEAGLTSNTFYTRYVWAYNSCGASPETTLTGQTTAYSIGQNYGGGIIFYIDGTGQHGLISATSDQSIGAQMGCYGTSIPGTSTAVGTGQANTTIIVNGCSEAGIAARICNDLVLGGYDDWFLPSKDELNLMYAQKTAIGGFAVNLYWSSSEYDAFGSWFQTFLYDAQSVANKYVTCHVRAVRAF